MYGSRFKHAYIYSGVDRVDSTKGYTVDNCESCCKTCNVAKANYSKKFFVEWVMRIHKNMVEKGVINE